MSFGLDRAWADYDVDAASPSRDESFRRFGIESEAVRARMAVVRDLAYGPHPREVLDVYGAAPDANRPVVLFIHGGYWKGGRKEDRGYPAEAVAAAGALWVPIEYPVAPEMRVEAIVDSIRRAILWVIRNIAAHGGDPARLHLVGNSAGGHLAAMMLATRWEDPAIRSALVISGLFDLRPLLALPVNQVLGLDAGEAARVSPLLLPRRVDCPVTLAVGALETDGFIRQSLAYLAHTGQRDRLIYASGHDHFSILGDLADPQSALFGAIARALR
jgi:arylformamidase